MSGNGLIVCVFVISGSCGLMFWGGYVIFELWFNLNDGHSPDDFQSFQGYRRIILLQRCSKLMWLKSQHEHYYISRRYAKKERFDKIFITLKLIIHQYSVASKGRQSNEMIDLVDSRHVLGNIDHLACTSNDADYVTRCIIPSVR